MFRATKYASTTTTTAAGIVVGFGVSGGLVATLMAATPSKELLCSPSSAVAPPQKLRVGVLGATGTVGQRFLERLEGHPWFEVTVLGASKRSAGKPYADVVNWQLGADYPPSSGPKVVTTCDPEEFKDCDLVFSALDSSVAGRVETAFAEYGLPVFSNAKNHRTGKDVPLVVPPVNGGHMEVVRRQPTFARSGGFIITNANCASTGLCIALKPIHDAFGITAAHVVTMQAISGAGYPGVSGLDILDNLVPRISGEEDKLEKEYKKILGGIRSEEEALKSDGDCWDTLSFPLSASANRVMVRDGHTLCVSLKLEKPATPEDVAAVLATFDPKPDQVSALPSAPDRFIVVRSESDRPQPRKDRDTGNGYTTVVGRIRECPLMDIKLLVVSHNTVMGAAGSSILNAELAVATGLVKRREPKA